LTRSFNGVLEGSEVSYLSNALLVVELVIMLPDVLIKINMKNERNMQKGIGNKLWIEGVTILMKVAMVYLIVMNMKLVKITDFSWLMIAMIFGIV